MKVLTSANGRFCVCTVPSLRLSRRAHFSAPPLLLPRPSHSYWPQQQSTVGQPGTKKMYKQQVGLILENLFKSEKSGATVSSAVDERFDNHKDILFFLNASFISSSVSILNVGLTFPADSFHDATFSSPLNCHNLSCLHVST